MTFLPLLFIFFFLTSIPFPAFSQYNDRSTLLNLKRDLGDPLSLRLWNDTSSPCNWPRITCTAGNVTEINFQNQNFTGTVPTTICNFPNLKSLNLSFNYFAGEFPTVLYNCTKLQYLDLSQNLFNGSLPDDINRLAPKLKYLDLAANSFAGDIPKNIGRISKLKVLNLYMSEYDGTFPSEIGDLSELEELQLALNDKFTPVKLPTEFGKLKKLKYMWLEEMNLIGEISAVVFENMTDLKHVDLSVNNLTGRIPDVLFGLKNLTELYLFANDLTGEIPKSISAKNLSFCISLSTS
jgi:Leucine-rich repeat (LRR) protein